MLHVLCCWTDDGKGMQWFLRHIGNFDYCWFLDVVLVVVLGYVSEIVSRSGIESEVTGRSGRIGTAIGLTCGRS